MWEWRHGCCLILENGKEERKEGERQQRDLGSGEPTTISFRFMRKQSHLRAQKSWTMMMVIIIIIIYMFNFL